MRLVPTLVLLFAALLLAPVSQAGWFDTQIELAPYRAGDAFRATTLDTWPSDDGLESRSLTDVARIEGMARAADKYGIERDTVHVRLDRYDGADLTYSESCHLLANGNQTVRHDVLAGSNGYGGTWDGYGRNQLLGSREAKITATPVATFWGGCPLYPVTVRTLEEGERIPVRALFPLEDLSGVADPGLSQPAEETEFHGRPALLVRFLLADMLPAELGVEGELVLTLADGLPGVVKAESRQTREGKTYQHRYELESYVAGEGAEVPLLGGAQLPERHPDAKLQPYGRLDLDHSAFPFPYTYQEAFANLAADPDTGFADFLDAHPDAYLFGAGYSRDARNEWQIVGGVSTETTDGGWWIALAEGDQTASWFTSRGHRTGALPLDVLRGPTAHVDNFHLDTGEPWFEVGQSPPPAETIDSATLARVVAVEGVKAEDAKTFWYGLYPGGDTMLGFFAVSNMDSDPESTEGTTEGRNVNVAAQTAAMTNVYSTTKRTNVDSLVPTTGGETLTPARKANAVEALAGPGIGVGLAGGAATGLAILVILVKFVLVPLFTRLRRDALLDNPVRARLYERIRAEPGIHRAELVDFLGVGEGATRHHLDQLTRHKLAVEMEDGGFVRYFAAGEVPREAAQRAALLRSPTARAVYDLYAAQPGVSLRDAGARLGLSAPSVHRAKKKLEKAGLLPAQSPAVVALR